MKVSCDDCNASIINGHASHEIGCNGFFIFTKLGKKYSRFTVWSLDVWGNKRDGFEVNDRSKRGTVYIKDDASDSEIIKALKKKEMINKRSHFASFKLDGDYTHITIDWKNSWEPIFQLERD